MAHELGCGKHTVYVYDRGGENRIGEITGITQVSWDRIRDDISTANIRIARPDLACCALLGDLRSMRHELVIFRDNDRVWEGPITRVAYSREEVEIEARDVMHYLYRRIIREGYSDAYPNVKFVAERARLNIVNGLSRGPDLNILPFLTVVTYPGDARTAKTVAAYSKTVWEEVDDLAANSGIDYVTVGRRIIIWDTHRRIGQLQPMGDGNFLGDPIVTEYGMNLATFTAVTNGQGVYGTAGGNDPYYGLVEMLASSYGESDNADAMESQAERNLEGRNPAPVTVRVPDGSTLDPSTAVTINELIPGVWIPLRSDATCRTLSQMQKLDSVKVLEDSDHEEVNVTMSPTTGDDSTIEELVV